MKPIPQSYIDLANSKILDVISKYLDLKKKGSEHVALCPFHSERTPSFTVNESKGFYHCFGCKANGDAIKFVMTIDNILFHEAVQKIIGNTASIEDSGKKEDVEKQAPQKTWQPILPVPDSAGPPPRIHNQREESHRWPYRNAEGQLIGYVSRFDHEGKKEILPQTYCVNSETGEKCWRRQSFDKPRPIYGLYELAQNPVAQVLVVEGEKACDAARVHFINAGISPSELVVISWIGGSNAVTNIDWSPLAGRIVTLWPDADQKTYIDSDKLKPILEQVGIVCMLNIASLINGKANAIRIVTPPPGVPDGWDLADEFPQNFDLLAHIKAAASTIDEFKAANAPVNEGLVLPRDEERRREQKDENAAIQEPIISIAPPIMTVEEMIRDCVWIADGSMVGLTTIPHFVKSFTDFSNLTAASLTYPEKGKGEPILNAKIWKGSRNRKTVDTRTFCAGAGVFCKDPDGKIAINSWRPIERKASKADIAPFLNQVAYLFPNKDEQEVFLDWLAHIEQRPGILPHYGWLHVAKNTGTGRNWLASLLCRIWRGYVAPNVDLPKLLDSQFNGELCGRVLAIVDEIQEAAGENPFRHANKLKSLVNPEFRNINPKYGRAYREHNACRWLVFSNHDNAIALSGTDRRWRVVQHDAAQLGPQYYATLYGLLEDTEFVNAVGVYLANRGISGFNPGERPPLNDDKTRVINASKSLIDQYAEQLIRGWPADVATNANIASILSDGHETTPSSAMRRSLEAQGCESLRNPVKISGRAQRVWILRNCQKWRNASPHEIAAEAHRAGSFSDHESAMNILTDIEF